MKLIVLTLAIFSFDAVYGQINVSPKPGGLSGSGITTRYWDCCKPSCGWVENVKNSNTAVRTCAADGNTQIDAEVQSACNNGRAYMCSNQQPTVYNSTLAIGYAAGSFSGGADNNFCCACFLLNFQGGLSGKQMIVEVTNTGGDLGSNQFDIAIPGGGVGIFTTGCSSQWGAPGSGWGDQYGGVRSASDCSQLPSALQSGCRFRFDFMQNVSNPPVTFTQINCPSQVTSATGCSA